MRELVPWYARIAAKVVLSRVPAGYALWRRLNFFSHGAMHRLEYAQSVFQHHFARLPAASGADLTLLEIGPGDSLLSALLGAAQGVARTYLVDVGAFASTDIEMYRAAARSLRDQGLTAPDLASVVDPPGVLRACNASYGTQGLASLREIPTASVDLIWSHAVLEHIRRAEFDDLAREMRRVLRPGGVCSHVIDLKDHLGGALNNLRIGSRWWESEWMARSGFYTNRLRQREIVRSFAAAHFAVNVLRTERWSVAPTPRSKFALEFQHLDPDELLVAEIDLTLTPN